VADRPYGLELALESLYRLYVLGLPALRSLDYGELNGLTFLQAAEAACLDSRVVNEYVFAVLPADEAVALRVIEPLNCSLFHCDTRSFGIDVAAIRPDCEAGRDAARQELLRTTSINRAS